MVDARTVMDTSLIASGRSMSNSRWPIIESPSRYAGADAVLRARLCTVTTIHLWPPRSSEKECSWRVLVEVVDVTVGGRGSIDLDVSRCSSTRTFSRIILYLSCYDPPKNVWLRGHQGRMGVERELPTSLDSIPTTCIKWDGQIHHMEPPCRDSEGL